MRRPPPAPLLAAALLAAACGSPRASLLHGPTLPPPPESRPARAEFPAGDAPAVLEAAQVVLRSRGDRISTASETRVVTSIRERDVPCAAGSCLAREEVVVRVGYRIAQVEVVRSVWNHVTRCWDADPEPTASGDARDLERRLLGRILGRAKGNVAAAPAP